VNFDSISAKSPLSVLSADPTNAASSGFYYTYVAGSSTFELTTQLESTAKHDTAVNDGDSFPGVYSKGSQIGLTPATRDLGLVEYWKFDEGTGGTASDSSGSGKNGTLTNGPNWTAGKVGNYALSFDGINDTVALPLLSNITNTTFTFTAWANFNSLGTYPMIFTLNSGRFELRLLNTTGKPEFVDNADSSTSPTAIATGQWYYLTGVHSNGVLFIYVNGVLQAQVSSNNSLPGSPSSYIGSRNGSGFFINGLIDDVRIYNRALSAAEIQAIYNATK
jgi:hypothetical protein